jgi:hypothetical protein
VFGGATCGLVFGPWVAAALGYPLETFAGWLPVPTVWVLSVLLLPAAWWSLGPWIDRGQLTLAAAVIPQVVLLINLLAAGAVVFPGVISTLVVLMPTALFLATQTMPTAASTQSSSALRRTVLPASLRLPNAACAGVVVGTLLVAAACLYTEYYPVMNGRLALADALFRLDQRQYRDAEPQALAAARADSLAPDPWRLLAELRLGRWQATGRESDWRTFNEAANAFRDLDPRNHLAWFTRGNWFLTAWRKSGQAEDLNEALAAYRLAAAHYPNRALYHAQLAWTLHLAGRTDEARQAAERAWQLDQQMPHRELKLDRQHVVDPDVSREKPRSFLEETAEQTVQRLRTASAEG